METTWKNEIIVYILCSINYEIKIFRFLRFSFDPPLYVKCAKLVLAWSLCSDVTDCDLKVMCVCLYNNIKYMSNNRV